MSTKHTPGPWACGAEVRNTNETTDIRSGKKNIARIAAYEFYHCTISETNANARRIVECVNACEGQNMEDVRFASAHRQACIEWEQAMKQLVGEDSIGSVTTAIQQLKAQRDELLAALNKIVDLHPKDFHGGREGAFAEARSIAIQITHDVMKGGQP